MTPAERTPSYYRAVIDFNFGGVQVKKGDIVPCHRKPWSALLDQGARYVAPVYGDDQVIDMALCPKGERVVLDRTGDTDRLAEPFNIELLTERLRLANARLLAYDGDPRSRPRLEAKAEGVRLALSYISDMTREDGPDE